MRSILYLRVCRAFEHAARDISKIRDQRRSGATTSQNCVSASQSRAGFRSFEYDINLPVYASARVPNWSALRELDWSRRGGSRHVPNIISQRAALGASKSKEPRLPVFPFSSPPHLSTHPLVGEGGCRIFPRRIIQKLRRGGRTLHSPGLPVIPDGTPL